MARKIVLDRHAVDRVARAIVSGRRGHGRRLDRLADAVASRMKNRLQAAAVPGAARARWLAVAPIDDRSLFDTLVERTGKHLASAVMVRTARAHARTATSGALLRRSWA